MAFVLFITLVPSHFNNFLQWWANQKTVHIKKLSENSSLCLSFIFVFPRQVRYLKIIEKSGYQALPWVRYITQNGGRLRVQKCLCSHTQCPYVLLLGNNWAMQCNVVGTNLVPMQFYEKGIQWRTWGNVATSCEMWESELFFLLRFPDLHTDITKVAHVGLFANVATNCQTSSSHFLCVPFILGGKHQLPPLALSPIRSFSLSIWLSLVHFLLRLPAPDPVGSASAGSRQVEIRGGGVEPLMCYQWQVSVTRPEDCQYLLFVFVFVFVEVLLISDQCK